MKDLEQGVKSAFLEGPNIPEDTHGIECSPDLVIRVVNIKSVTVTTQPQGGLHT